MILKGASVDKTYFSFIDLKNMSGKGIFDEVISDNGVLYSNCSFRSDNLLISGTNCFFENCNFNSNRSEIEKNKNVIFRQCRFRKLTVRDITRVTFEQCEIKHLEVIQCKSIDYGQYPRFPNGKIAREIREMCMDNSEYAGFTEDLS